LPLDGVQTGFEDEGSGGGLEDAIAACCDEVPGVVKGHFKVASG
jgi:hypothetical protein